MTSQAHSREGIRGTTVLPAGRFRIDARSGTLLDNISGTFVRPRDESVLSFAANPLLRGPALAYASTGPGGVGLFHKVDGGYLNEFTDTVSVNLVSQLDFDGEYAATAGPGAVERTIQNLALSGYSVLTVTDELPGAVEAGWSGIAYLAVRPGEGENADGQIDIESIVVIDPDTVRHEAAATPAAAADAERPELQALAADSFTGEVSRTDIDLSVPNVGIPVGVTRTYRSEALENVGFGRGWTFEYAERIVREDS